MLTSVIEKLSNVTDVFECVFLVISLPLFFTLYDMYIVQKIFRGQSEEVILVTNTGWNKSGVSYILQQPMCPFGHPLTGESCLVLAQ